MKSLKLSRYATLVDDQESHIRKLYNDAWRKPFNTLFEKRTIQRSEGDGRVNTATCYVPEDCLVCKGFGEVILRRLFGISGILVRDEYIEALHAALALSRDSNARVKVDDDANDDCFSTGDEDKGDKHDDSMNVDDDQKVDGKSRDQIMEDTGGRNVGRKHHAVLPEFDNPFIGVDPMCEPESSGKGIAVIGHPGIGKSLFLQFVLCLRLLAGQPTAYQVRPDSIHVVTDDGVFYIALNGLDPTVFADYFPTSTWCLIDSTNELKDVSLVVRQLGFFIVQAASPRKERIEWLKKERASEYYMKPWTLPEIIAGRMLQTLSARITTECQLAHYFVNYGPSARLAYNDASRPQEMLETRLKASIRSIKTFDRLDDIFRDSVQRDLSHEASHRIVLILPDRFRDEFKITIQTKHVYDLLLGEKSMLGEYPARRLYGLFLTNPFTKAAAGNVLENLFSAVFCMGGSWEIKPMTRNAIDKNVHWKTLSPSAPSSWLTFGAGDSVMEISDKEQEGPFRTICRINFVHKENLKLDDGFYCPVSRTQGAFDAFVYESDGRRASIFQAIVSETGHKAKAEELAWLRKLGVECFRFVAVTPPDLPLDFTFPKEWDPLVTETYHLEFE